MKIWRNFRLLQSHVSVIFPPHGFLKWFNELFWFLLSFYRIKPSFLFWCFPRGKFENRLVGKETSAVFTKERGGFQEWSCLESNSVRFMISSSNSITQRIFLFVLKVKKKLNHSFPQHMYLCFGIIAFWNFCCTNMFNIWSIFSFL